MYKGQIKSKKKRVFFYYRCEMFWYVGIFISSQYFQAFIATEVRSKLLQFVQFEASPGF